jgi:hypothetical protein
MSRVTWREPDIPPSDLPESDLWAIDIKGGEVGLLEEAVNQDQDITWPNKVIIEPHPSKGGSVGKLRSLLKKIDDVKEIEVIKASENSNYIAGNLITVDFYSEQYKHRRSLF